MDKLHTPMSTQETADFFGISKDTLRFYEQKGIIPAVPRDSNNYRIYGNYELNLIYLVLNLKKLGLSLSSISKFVHLCIYSNRNSFNEQKQILSNQIQKVDKKIIELEINKQLLTDKISKFDTEFAKYGTKERFKDEPFWKKYEK